MRVAIAGFGFMGRMHYGCWKNVAGVEVVALCDKDQRQFQEPVTTGNVSGADTSTDYGEAKIYDDWEKMLAETKPDILDVTLPTWLHLPVTCQALARGIHVLCEKPMALNTSECDQMIKAWRGAPAGTELMIGQCLRFRDEYVYAKKLVDSGEYGKVLSARFARFSMPPGWGRDALDNWFFDDSRSGGVALDLHIHDTDTVNFIFGIPRAVSSSAYYDRQKIMRHIATQYDVGGPLVLAEGAWTMSRSFGFEREFKIVFEKATLVLASRHNPEFCLYPDEGEPFTPEIGNTNAYQNQANWFVEKINGKNTDTPTSPESCRDSVRIVDAEKHSALHGGWVKL